MRYQIHAILAVLAIICLAGRSDLAQDEIRVRFHMADGTKIEGTLTKWSENHIDGSFGRRAWTELDAKDVWTLYRKVMDIESAPDWANLGRVLLICSLDQPRAIKNAERSFARAKKIDPAMSEKIQAARDEVQRIIAERKAEAEAQEADQLQTDTPEGHAWRPVAWPAMTDSQRNAAVLTMRADAAALLEVIDLELVPVETDYFLFYSDMPRRESAKWARQLDRMYEKLAEIFDLEEGYNLFWGKAVIFVFSEQARFQEFEAKAFRFLVTDQHAGLCHPVGPKVFVDFFRQPDDLQFAALLVHETVHGFMHRYKTPRRLPTWANEGFADYVASVSFRNSPVDRKLRRQGVRFVREGNEVDRVLEMSYQDQSWPGPDAVGYSVSYLMVKLMIQDRPRNFGKWVNAIKDGEQWEDAMEDVFGVDRARLVDRFTRYHRVND